MTANALPLVYGTVAGSPIVGAVSSATLATKTRVTLSGAYARNPPPGYPDPNAGAYVGISPTAFAQTIPGGTPLTLFSDEAAALVAASAATYS